MKNSADWYKSSRSYLHFDDKVSRKKALSIVKSPERVASWNFFPFLHTTFLSSKVMRDKCGDLVQETKERDIRYAGHMDSHIYSYYALKLEKRYEDLVAKYDLQNNVLAYRKVKDRSLSPGGLCNIHFAKQAFDKIKTSTPCVAIAFDIEKFFDEMDHRLLKDSWSRVIGSGTLPADHYAVFKSLTKFSFVDRKSVFKIFGINRKSKKNGIHRICSAKDFRQKVRNAGHVSVNKTGKGIPQGSPVSGLLSNIYLFDFDVAMKRIVQQWGGTYLRYSDDIIIICNVRHSLFIRNMVYSLLQKNLVKAHSKKTVVRTYTKNKQNITCDNPIQYLGFIFDGQRALIRSSSYMRFIHRMGKGVELARQTTKKYNIIRRRNGLSARSIYRRKLYSRYSYLGRRNFISYAHKSAKIMNEPAIKKQVKPLWNRLKYKIKHASNRI